MGYARYTLPDGREAGYGVNAVCDDPTCTIPIDRGMAYLCGNTPGGDEYGCGGYFCGRHLYGGPEGSAGGQCRSCRTQWDTETTP